MEWIERLLAASVQFVDREGSRAAIELYYPASADLDALFTALVTESAFAAVSDCQRVDVSLTAGAVNAVGGIATGLNLDIGALVFQTGAQTYGSFLIPGLKPALLLQTGCFAGYAIDLLNPDVIAFGQAVVAAGVCTPRQAAFTQLVGGGVRGQWNVLLRRSG